MTPPPRFCRKMRCTPQLSVVLPNGQAEKPGENVSDSAKYGGFSHSPCPPWFQEESWKIAYPPRITVFWLPNAFQAKPIRGSIADLSSRIPTAGSEATQKEHAAVRGLTPATYILPVAKSKFAWRF